MLFHKTTRKVLNVGLIVVGIVVIASMMLLYFPALWQA